MEKELNTPMDLELGTILADWWNGMADFYQVISTTNKSVKLRKIEWETCAPDEKDEDFDPTHRTARIKLGDDGDVIPEKDWQGNNKIIRKMVKFCKDGGFYIPTAWNACGSMKIVTDLKKKYSFYWG